jgi:hypothetical protein
VLKVPSNHHTIRSQYLDVNVSLFQALFVFGSRASWDGGKRKQEREVQISVGEDGGTQVTVQDVLLRKTSTST